MILHEFDIITNYFAKQGMARDDVVLGIGDDSAILDVPSNQHLVVTTDTLIEGVHFPTQTSAYDIGYRSLAVNLSDLAAMGSTPAWFTLALTLPHADEQWLKEFCRGLFTIADHYRIQLVGGNLSRGALSITITAHGLIPKNQSLKRSGAQAGDLIFVTHTLGDAAAGLQVIENKIQLPEKFKEYLLQRFNRPEPQIETGLQLRNNAHAAIDISDGLAADLSHILVASGVGATVYVDDIPLSKALRTFDFNQALEFALSGGDDYELCFTLPKEKVHLLSSDCTCIGFITEKPGLDLRFKDGSPYNGLRKGYQHFLK